MWTDQSKNNVKRTLVGVFVTNFGKNPEATAVKTGRWKMTSPFKRTVFDRSKGGFTEIIGRFQMPQNDQEARCKRQNLIRDFRMVGMIESLWCRTRFD